MVRMLSGRAQHAVVGLAAVLGVLLTARLGLWQLDRAAEKEALQEAVEASAELPPLSMQALARTPTQAAEQRHRRVEVRGRWLAEHTVFLDNRQMDGRPGFFVFTPMLLDDGSVVLVQRGWVPRDMQERTRLPSISTPAQPVTLTARVERAPARLYEFTPQGGEAGAIRQNLSIASFAGETHLPLRPLTLLQLDDKAPAADGLLRRWPLPAVDVHKHYGYAVQWFSLAALITGLYVWFQLLRPRWRAD
ncbi:SURF1 family protein [Azohydromonas caseinilytica]|uniref:SURF1-like protein n=1 Tax=Azohydromonas caseinilytica TaxID=2728836 RepID=A0A848F6Y7_9BURK|nr:SURF1 family protein [Azohydromonas caseinilytica]NML15122.1 SURF1 family protein [Azohydromonas caseinilytica]